WDSGKGRHFPERGNHAQDVEDLAPPEPSLQQDFRARLALARPRPAVRRAAGRQITSALLQGLPPLSQPASEPPVRLGPALVRRDGRAARKSPATDTPGGGPDQTRAARRRCAWGLGETGELSGPRGGKYCVRHRAGRCV